ncbi:MAG TPA: zinc ribbon domain-containing protein [Deltaproteobacteria bacterium]|nr:zinc ribbon domain-containing protein [Deltaproteobacteria bacterium]
MPIYEYRCRACSHVTTVLVQGYNAPTDLSCEECGSGDLKRIISQTNYHSSPADRLSSYDPKARQTEGFYRDSRNIGVHAEHMLNQAGVKPTEEFRNKLEKLRTDPSSVIKDSDD